MAYRDVAAFLVISFGLASMADVLVFTISQNAPSPLVLSQVALLWGLFRMYTPTIGAAVASRMSGKSISGEFKSYLNVRDKAVYWYFLAPLIVYIALGIYFLLGLAFHVIDLEKPVKIIAEQGKMSIEVARVLLLVQLVSAYPVALTINALYALGEEIGWRGYLYKRLGSAPSLKNSFIIGTVWGLWHATAIGLLGHNYPNLKWLGVPIFVALCIPLTFIMLILVSRTRSILPTVSLHGALNALWALTILTNNLEDATGELLGGNGLLGILSLVLVAIIAKIFLGTRSYVK
jgi:membrane protease YdiL (CAAX protease family)